MIDLLRGFAGMFVVPLVGEPGVQEQRLFINIGPELLGHGHLVRKLEGGRTVEVAICVGRRGGRT